MRQERKGGGLGIIFTKKFIKEHCKPGKIGLKMLKKYCIDKTKPSNEQSAKHKEQNNNLYAES